MKICRLTIFGVQATSKVDPDLQKQRREEQARKFKEMVAKRREEKVESFNDGWNEWSSLCEERLRIIICL